MLSAAIFNFKRAMRLFLACSSWRFSNLFFGKGEVVENLGIYSKAYERE